MKSHQLIGLIGILVLLIGGFLPLAYLNNVPISIFPVFKNFSIEGVWIWRDISAFAVTFGIALILSIYLIIKSYKPGYLIAASLSLIAFLFMYISIWLTSIKAEDYTSLPFVYSLWALVFLIGYLLLYYGGLKITKAKKKGTN